MNLDERQKQMVAAWIREGLTLSQLQAKLASELALRLTYMEVRFLMDDLKLKPKDVEPSPAVAPSFAKDDPRERAATADPKAGGRRKEPASSMSQPGAGAAGRVAVDVDQVTRPGAMVSGNVAFADGHNAEWYLDQLGRLGVVPKQAGYKPSQKDLMEFQAELQNELAKRGF